MLADSTDQAGHPGPPTRRRAELRAPACEDAVHNEPDDRRVRRVGQVGDRKVAALCRHVGEPSAGVGRQVMAGG